MQKFWLRFSIIVLALGAVLPAVAAEGRTPVFLDGTVIGSDGKYILTRDIVSVSGVPVITILAPNVDLDLNGFTIFAVPGVSSIEIPPAPIADIKIHNGSIVGGATGIIRHPGGPAERIVIEDMKLRDQTFDAIALHDTIETVHIRRTSIRRVGGSGILIIGAGFTNGSIEQCSIKETGGSGILLDTVAAFEIAHNNLEIPAIVAGGGHGIELIKAVGILVNQNTISDPGGNGIDLVDSKGNKIYNNVIRHAFTTGIHVDPGSGDNLILNNVATDCGFDFPPGHGLHVEGFQNQIHGNTLNGNWGCGMLFAGTSFFNTFGRNMARGNGLLGSCPAACLLLFPPDSCDMAGFLAGNDTSTENMIPALF